MQSEDTGRDIGAGIGAGLTYLVGIRGIGAGVCRDSVRLCIGAHPVLIGGLSSLYRIAVTRAGSGQVGNFTPACAAVRRTFHFDSGFIA